MRVSMRSLSLSFFLGIGTLLPHCSAQSQPDSYRNWTPQALYDYGIDRLKHGKSFVAAIEVLKLAGAREPENPRFQSALGCAYACRFASISYAFQKLQLEESELRQHDRRVRNWTILHEDPASPLYLTPPPAAYVPPYTPDDRKPFTLSREDALHELQSYARNSLGSLRLASDLSERLSPDRKAETAFMVGWGYLLLHRLGKLIITDSTQQEGSEPHAPIPERQPPRLSREEIIACFKGCTEHDPDKPEYWQSLAISLAPSCVSEADRDVIESYEQRRPLHPRDKTDEAIRAVDRALKLKPKDPKLLLLKGLICAPTDVKEAIDTFQALLKRNGANSVAWYLLAEQKFRLAETLKGDEALEAQMQGLSAIEVGNSNQGYRDVTIEVPIPAEMKIAWYLRNPNRLWDEAMRPNMLFSYLTDFGRQRKEKRDGDAIMRAGLTQMDLGLRGIRCYEGSDVVWTDPMYYGRLNLRALFGMLNCSRGYEHMKYALEISPSDRFAAIVEANASNQVLARKWDELTVR